MKITNKFWLIVLCFCIVSATLFAVDEPEEIADEDIRQELFTEDGPVKQFFTQASERLNIAMAEAVESGEMDPTDQESVMAQIAKQAEVIFANAEEFRKSLEEPEYRLMLDMELLSLAAQSRNVDRIVSIAKKWKGEIQEAMILDAAQKLQSTRTKFTPEFEALLTQVASSENEQYAAVATALNNEFVKDPIGKQFPPFPEGHKTTDGEKLSLDRFKGKIVLVDFWASWCPPCRAEMDGFVKLYNEYNEKGFEIIGISFDEDKEKFEAFIEEKKMAWPQYFDGKGWENEIGPKYMIQSIPTLYLLDREGKIITNDLSGSNLEDLLKKLL